MLQNAYLVAKIGADTAENEQHFAEILPTDALDGVEDEDARLVAAVRDPPVQVRAQRREVDLRLFLLV